MQKIIKIGPIVYEKNNRTDTHTDGRTHRQGSNYRPIFVPKDRSKNRKKLGRTRVYAPSVSFPVNKQI